jgi:hypothetical protein
MWYMTSQFILPELPAVQQVLQDVIEIALILWTSHHESQTSFQTSGFLKNHWQAAPIALWGLQSHGNHENV